MITIAIPPRHSVIVTTKDEPKHHFGRLISATGASLVVELRKPLASLADLSVTGLTLDTFVEVEEGAMAMISIQFDVRYVAAHGDRIVRLHAIEPQKIRFTMPRRLP